MLRRWLVVAIFLAAALLGGSVAEVQSTPILTTKARAVRVTSPVRAATPSLSSQVLATPSGSQGLPVPVQTLRQIKAEYGQFTYVPGFVPRGYIFTSWRIEQPAFGYLMERLRLTFGRRGTRLVWTISDGRDQDDLADCSKRRYYDVSRTIAGRLVYYVRGNHGDSAWTCFSTASRSGYRQPIGIDLWIANEQGRPSRLAAMQIVASVRRF